MRPKYVFGLAILFSVAIVIINSTFMVQETQQAMVLRLGKVDRLVAEPGLHVKLPLIQQIYYFDKRILETDSSAEEVQTIDKKRVVVDSFTRWRIVDAQNFYQAVRTENTAVQRINSIVNSNIRRVVASETLEELVSGDRARLMQEIENEATKEAKPFGVEIVDVRIKRADLPTENSLAVFKRMRTEREKEAKEIRAEGEEKAQKLRAEADRERTVILAGADREAQVLRGQGDALAIKVTGAAFSKNPQFYNLMRSLEAYEESLSGTDTLILLDPSMEFLQKFKQR